MFLRTWRNLWKFVINWLETHQERLNHKDWNLFQPVWHVVNQLWLDEHPIGCARQCQRGSVHWGVCRALDQLIWSGCDCPQLTSVGKRKNWLNSHVVFVFACQLGWWVFQPEAVWCFSDTIRIPSMVFIVTIAVVQNNRLWACVIDTEDKYIAQVALSLTQRCFRRHVKRQVEVVTLRTAPHDQCRMMKSRVLPVK